VNPTAATTLMQWFMPKSIRVFQEQIRRDAKEAVDGLMERGGECDFAHDFAMLYPLRVIMTLLGVPREDEPMMLKLTQDFFGTREPDAKPAAPAADPAATAKQWHAGVAKREMRTLWDEPLPRLGAAELTKEPVYVASNWVGGLKNLPVRITPA